MPLFDLPGTRSVTLIHAEGSQDEIRSEVKANVQPNQAFFDLKSGVQEGDVITYVDGRGLEVRRVITRLKVYDAGTSLDHIEAKSGSRHRPGGHQSDDWKSRGYTRRWWRQPAASSLTAITAKPSSRFARRSNPG